MLKQKLFEFHILKSILYHLLFLLLFAALVFIQVVHATVEFDYGSKEFQDIVSKLYMQGHADHDLSTCSIKATYYKEVADMMQQGKTDDQIINYYVEQYGESALKVPSTEGFSLMAWIAPFAALLIAAVVIFIVVRSWVYKNKLQLLTTTEQDATISSIDESTRSKIDEERKKYL